MRLCIILKCNYSNNNKMVLEGNKMGVRGMDATGSAKRQLKVCCGHGNKISGSKN
jgi:hypothetical protein